MLGNRIFSFIFAITFLVLFSLNGCTGVPNGTGTTPSTDSTRVLQDESVSAQGEVVPEKWASLAFARGGSDLDIRVSIGNSVIVGQLLATVNNVAQQAAVSNAEAALSSAQANLTRLQDLNAGETDISVAQEDVDAAQADLDQAQESLDATELKAPFDGVIVNIFLQDFENAPPGQPVLLLADLSSLVVETTDLGEVDFARVQVDDPATLVFDALPDVTVAGRVIRMALHPETGAGTYYTVTIQLDEVPANLLWGMSSFVEIQTAANTSPVASPTRTPFSPVPTHQTPSQDWGYPTATLTPTASNTPTRTPRPYIPPPVATWTVNFGNQEPATPTASRTPTSTHTPTPTFTLPPPTATGTPTDTPQPVGSPTITRTHPPIGISTATPTP